MIPRRRPNRDLQDRIANYQLSTRERQQRDRMVRWVIMGGVSVVAFIILGIAISRSLDVVMNHELYNNPRYALQQIEIEPRELFSPHQIRETANIDFGDNLWKLDLKKITEDLQTLPYVSSARVERLFPNKIIIRIRERVPLVKISGINPELGTPETFYLDRDRIVLKPRANETLPPLPEIIGLNPSELEAGQTVDEPMLTHALTLLDMIQHTPLPLHNTIDVQSIDLSHPLSIRVVTTRDTTIIFRLDFIDQQLNRLQKIMDMADSSQRTLRTVDLTEDRLNPVTFFD
jgi:cell division septal protein FtsQ